jgi:hypothetical protein
MLSEKVKFKIEKIILVIGMISFIVHLLIIYLKRYGLISLFDESNFLIIQLQLFTHHFHLF